MFKGFRQYEKDNNIKIILMARLFIGSIPEDGHKAAAGLAKG
jgi:hypothetical protein